MKFETQCKVCRREGKKLFLKGERCNTVKCTLVKKKYPPGMHGPKGYPRLSDYGRQLREKQQLRHSYFLSEKQFKNYFRKAKDMTGNSEENFLKLLEKRLDNVVFRAGFAESRKKARQLVTHGNILVNGRRVDVPAYSVKISDTVKLKEKKLIIERAKEQFAKKSKESFPAWMSVDDKKLETKILKDPGQEDLPREYEMELIVGFYSR